MDSVHVSVRKLIVENQIAEVAQQIYDATIRRRVLESADEQEKTRLTDILVKLEKKKDRLAEVLAEIEKEIEAEKKETSAA